MRILGLHDGTACGHYRVLLPLRQMAAHGHDVTVRFHDGVVAPDPEDYDVVIGQRLSDYGSLRPWSRLRGLRVYDQDDDVFRVTPENWNAYNAFADPVVRESVRAMAEASDMVTVTCRRLAEVFAPFARRVRVLPNCISSAALTAPVLPRDRHYIGWTGGNSHARDMFTAASAVRRVLREFPDWGMTVGGADYREAFTDDPGAVYRVWTSVTEDEASYYSSLAFDIGICPVLDTDFSQGKSPLKAIEMNARGIPVVASDIAPYRDYVVHGGNGFLARTAEEWHEYVRLLVVDEGLRNRMSANARRMAAMCTIEGNWKRWEAAYGG